MVQRFPRLQHLVVNIRGTNGSGKSFLVHTLLNEFGAVKLGIDDKLVAYRLKNTGYPQVYIIGKYETPTGGCDTIRDINDVNRHITNLSEMGHVLFEGLIATGLSGRWIDLEKELKPWVKWKFVTLDTPLDKCIERVNRRRHAKGKPDLEDPRNIVSKDRAVKNSFNTLKEAGLDIEWVDRKKAYGHVCKLLGLAGK